MLPSLPPQNSSPPLVRATAFKEDKKKVKGYDSKAAPDKDRKEVGDEHTSQSTNDDFNIAFVLVLFTAELKCTIISSNLCPKTGVQLQKS